MHGGPLYSASKHALLGLMRSLAGTYELKGIRISSIHPWFAGTQSRPATCAIPFILSRHQSLDHGQQDDPRGCPVDTCRPHRTCVASFVPSCSMLSAESAGATVYSATDPDPETHGCPWLLPDDGPLYLIKKEELREGVYGMLTERVRRARGGV